MNVRKVRRSCFPHVSCVIWPSPGPCILTGPRDIAHTVSTHTGALSSRSRGCLLPAVLGVRRIPYRAMTGATHGTPLPPLGRRDPAPILARDNVARWGELHVVTASAGTTQRHRLGLPDLIMPVSLPHEGMGDLMQECVVNVRVWGHAGIRMGKGDDLRLIVTAARAFRGVIKLETPALELVRRDPGGGTPCNGLEVAVRALACARRRGCTGLLWGQPRIGDPIFTVIITDDMGVARIDAADGPVEDLGTDREGHAVAGLPRGSQGV